MQSNTTLSSEPIAQYQLRNSVLQHLPAASFARLHPHLERVTLRRRQILQEPNRPMEALYFIESGIVSLFSRTRADGPVQVAVVGRYGFIGVPIVLGSRQSPLRAIVEVPGNALRITADKIQHEMNDATVRQHMMNYVHARLIQHTQAILCNARHSIEERLSRWLLLAHDRLDGDLIPITHDLLSVMLGVRRAGITAALAALEQRGALRRNRGVVTIRERALLERSCCECYRIIADEYGRLLAPMGFPVGRSTRIAARPEAPQHYDRRTVHVAQGRSPPEVSSHIRQTDADSQRDSKHIDDGDRI